MFAVLPSGERKFMWHLKEHVYSGEKPWTPSTDIATAWELVELYDGDFYLDRDVNPELCLGSWYALFGKKLDDGCHGSTAPEAICRAFLKVKATP